MTMLFKSLLPLLALWRTVSATKFSLRRKVEKDNAHHLHFRCFMNTSQENCDFLMSTVIKEQEREIEADLKAGRKHRQLKAEKHNSSSSKLPGEGSAPDWWGEDEDEEVTATRLRDDCEEPEDPPQNVGGWGPDKIYCCHTAQALVQDLKEKKEHCDSDPPVDCWKSLREILPNYIAHYTKRRDYLCRTTTTTTVTTTTSTVTTTKLVREGSVRLMPNDGHEGRVEIRHNNEWGTVCNDNFEGVDASVVCKQLGLPGGKRVSIDEYGEGKGKIWLDEVGCTGSEDRLMSCPHNGWEIHNCDHSKDVAIKCEEAAPAPANAPAPVPDWCLETCKKHTEAEKTKCEALCAEIAERMVHRDECDEHVKTASEGTTTMASAPAPSNK